ncbi:MAG: MiaB/RimO family radical SAM methylthiotransferase [bacterium]
MRVHFLTHGCKANQYDTEKYRQELEARGARLAATLGDADAVVINTCTVTNQADVEARKAIRKIGRTKPDVKIVVAGCSAAMRADDYRAMDEVYGVVAGQDAVQVADALLPDAILRDEESIGGELLSMNRLRSRGWLKVQDGCNRRCSFCATRIARGESRSRDIESLVAEAEILSDAHRELVITGVHIGHYGLDLNGRKSDEFSLSKLMARLLEAVPNTRFRLGSIEATEIDDLMVDLMASPGSQLAPHFHIPMQSGSDHVLRAMKRWHTREQYRRRVLEIAERVPGLGLGADIIVGFPTEGEEHHAETRALVEELPFTYLHVFPYSERSGTPAAEMSGHLPGDVKSARSQELRDIAHAKGTEHMRRRAGTVADIVLEQGDLGITEDYLRVRMSGDWSEDRVTARLDMAGDDLCALPL